MSILQVNKVNARIWSKLGPRAVYGQAILALAKECAELIVLSSDLGNSSGLDRFKATYPDKFLNVGIAEQNLVGVAAGIAKEGFVVFASSFAPFIALRASEQVRMNLGYMQLNVKAVGIGSGLSMGFLGNSHYELEDAAVMRSIPGITVVSPADCGEIVKTVFAAAEFEGPMYIRLTGGPGNPVVYNEDYDFKIGKAVTLREGKQVALVTCGTMVHQALEVAELLDEEKISAAVYNMHTLKPLDSEVLHHIINKFELIVTIEEHSIIGGLGSAVAEFKAEFRNSPPQLILGLPDNFGKTGEYKYLLEKYKLTAKYIFQEIISLLRLI